MRAAEFAENRGKVKYPACTHLSVSRDQLNTHTRVELGVRGAEQMKNDTGRRKAQLCTLDSEQEGGSCHRTLTSVNLGKLPVLSTLGDDVAPTD